LDAERLLRFRGSRRSFDSRTARHIVTPEAFVRLANNGRL
jgi:hypothetical protein